MTIIVNNYFREEKFQYKDETTNWELVDGGSWYFINIRKLMENEILQADKQPPLSSICGLVDLPDGPGIYYEGPGVLFTVDGSTYDMAEENRTVFESAIKSGKEIKWSYNSDRARKFGVSGNNTVTVRVMDKQARLIPDLSLTIQVN